MGSRDGGIVSVFLGVGGGLLGPRVDLDAGSSIVGLAVGDFNGDGRPDLVAADSTAGPFAVQLADPLGGFRRMATTFTIGAGLAAVVVADFDGNGRADLALAFSSGLTVVLGGNGQGNFTVGSSQALALTTSAAAVGDFDRDGLPDLVAVHPAGNVVSVRLNTTVPAGAGSFVATPPTSPQSSPSDPQPVALFLADLASFRLGVPRFDGFLDAVAVDTDEVNVAIGTTLGVFPPFSTGGAPWRRRSPTSTATGGPTCCWLRPRGPSQSSAGHGTELLRARCRRHLRTAARHQPFAGTDRHGRRRPGSRRRARPGDRLGHLRVPW